MKSGPHVVALRKRCYCPQSLKIVSIGNNGDWIMEAYRPVIVDCGGWSFISRRTLLMWRDLMCREFCRYLFRTPYGRGVRIFRFRFLVPQFHRQAANGYRSARFHRVERSAVSQIRNLWRTCKSVRAYLADYASASCIWQKPWYHHGWFRYKLLWCKIEFLFFISSNFIPVT